jgi:hypothetical protein
MENYLFCREKSRYKYRFKAMAGQSHVIFNFAGYTGNWFDDSAKMG